MERSSNIHGPRLDDALAHEVESLTRGAPVEARVEESRVMEDAGEGEPVPEAVIAEVHEAGPDAIANVRHPVLDVAGSAGENRRFGNGLDAAG